MDAHKAENALNEFLSVAAWTPHEIQITGTVYSTALKELRLPGDQILDYLVGVNRGLFQPLDIKPLEKWSKENPKPLAYSFVFPGRRTQVYIAFFLSNFTGRWCLKSLKADDGRR